MSADSGAYRFVDCPFCGSEIRHVESWAGSFDPPRLYHEWQHVDQNDDCWICRRGSVVGSASDDADEQARVIRRWNACAALAATPSEPSRAHPKNCACDRCQGRPLSRSVKETAATPVTVCSLCLGTGKVYHENPPRKDTAYSRCHCQASTQPAAIPTSPADEIIGQIEARFPDWKGFRDLIDCIDVTLHRLRGGR